MNTHLEEFFKNTPLGINSVLRSSVILAEKVNTRTDLSGKEKCELVIKTLVEYLGEGNPELVALVEGIIPGMLELVVSTARGGFKLHPVKKACMAWAMPAFTVPTCIPSYLSKPNAVKELTGVPAVPDVPDVPAVPDVPGVP
jgi:hypothetical protein